MNKLIWCCKQRDGIRIVEPSQNIAEAYLKKAEDALESMRINKIRDWKIATAYYTMYFSLYAILMRLGIKCGIHACTIEFVENFLHEFFIKQEMDFLREALKARVDAQYYINRQVKDMTYEGMLKKAPEIFVKCKSVILQLTEQKIETIRDKVENILRGVR